MISGRTASRVLFAFDPERRAILLVAEDKVGDWTCWYKKNIPVADGLFDESSAQAEPAVTLGFEESIPKWTMDLV